LQSYLFYIHSFQTSDADLQRRRGDRTTFLVSFFSLCCYLYASKISCVCKARGSLSKDCKVTCFIYTVFQLLTPIYREGEEIERRSWSHFEAFVVIYMLLKYRAYVKLVVGLARIAKLLVLYTQFFNF
jgi:hypothetical protein